MEHLRYGSEFCGAGIGLVWRRRIDGPVTGLVADNVAEGVETCQVEEL